MDESKLPWDADYPVSASLISADGKRSNRSGFISPCTAVNLEWWDSLNFATKAAWLDNAAREWALAYVEFSWDAPAQQP